MTDKEKVQEEWHYVIEEYAKDNCPYTQGDEDSDPPEDFGIECGLEAIDLYKSSLRSEVEKRIGNHRGMSNDYTNGKDNAYNEIIELLDTCTP